MDKDNDTETEQQKSVDKQKQSEKKDNLLLAGFKILLGFTKIAASPATSGIEVTLDVITGQPQYCASRIGNPKPSYRDGKSKAIACFNKNLIAEISRYPVNII